MRSLRTLAPLLAISALIVGALVFTSGKAPSDSASSGPVAPDFAGGSDWLNSSPLTIAGLRGKVVLVDFWTYSCINCQRTLPFLQQWWQKYRDRGLIIVGVHTPEFSFEKDPANVQQALKTYNVAWPVVLDNDMAIWNAYQNHYWPHKYLIDRSGRVIYDHIGEGGYIETEQRIAAALGLDAAAVQGQEPPPPSLPNQTPELYAGYKRGEFANREPVRPNVPIRFGDPHRYPPDQIVLAGGWIVRDEYIQPVPENHPGEAKIFLSYRAKDLYAVIGNAGGLPLRVYALIDGQPLNQYSRGPDIELDDQGRTYIEVTRQDLYRVVAKPLFSSHMITLWSDSSDFRFYTFTFGS